MSRLTLNQYLQNIKRSIGNRNGKILSFQLKCTDGHAHNPRLAESEPENHVMRVIKPPWDEIVSAHIRCIWALRNRSFEEAYACQLLVVKAISKIFMDCKENWMLPVVLVISVDIRKLAHGLDMTYSMQNSNSKKNTYGNKMENTAQLIMRLFQICASDGRSNAEESKKCGMMGLANQLFKIYFQINKLNLCKSMIRAIDNMSMDEHFSIAQRVTYRYYVGRKAMFDGDFVAADKFLSFSFKHCVSNNYHNKRLILVYLIPVRMLLGVMPLDTLLYKYNLKEFLGIVEATKIGNFQKLTDELAKHENFFISCGIYLILEKLKLITYRNLFKKVASLFSTHLLPIQAFAHVLKEMGIDDIDTDETECILATLIHAGRIKGYVAHQQQKLVVSKTIPFPPLC